MRHTVNYCNEYSERRFSKLTPAECIGAFGKPVVPEVKFKQMGWLNGSCSKIISGTFPSGVRPSCRKSSKKILQKISDYVLIIEIFVYPIQWIDKFSLET